MSGISLNDKTELSTSLPKIIISKSDNDLSGSKEKDLNVNSKNLKIKTAEVMIKEASKEKDLNKDENTTNETVNKDNSTNPAPAATITTTTPPITSNNNISTPPSNTTNTSTSLSNSNISLNSAYVAASTNNNPIIPSSTNTTTNQNRTSRINKLIRATEIAREILNDSLNKEPLSNLKIDKTIRITDKKEAKEPAKLPQLISNLETSNKDEQTQAEPVIKDTTNINSKVTRLVKNLEAKPKRDVSIDVSKDENQNQPQKPKRDSSRSSKPEIKRMSAIGFLKFHGFGMNQIIPRLFLSGQDVTNNKKLLDENKITHVLNLATNIENSFENEITYKTLKIQDSITQDILKHLAECIEFIDTALKNEKNSVLVHCNAGVSRSASIVIAYLMFKRLFNTYQAAYEHVLSCRSVISPNPGFVKQLLEFETLLNSFYQNTGGTNSQILNNPVTNSNPKEVS